MATKLPTLDGLNLRIGFADSRESSDSRESFQGSRTEPIALYPTSLRGLKVANRRFEAIRASRLNVVKMEVFLRIDSREKIANSGAI